MSVDHRTDTERERTPHESRRAAEQADVWPASSSGDSTLLECLRAAQYPLPLGIEAGFELLEEVGRGGQGVVYRARELSSGRLVALKRIRASIGAIDPDDRRDEVRRLRRETAIGAVLTDDRIAPTERIVEVASQVYAVRRFVEGVRSDVWAACCGGGGVDVAGRLPRRAQHEVVNLVREVCHAMALAHRHGVVHRDLKPGNILVRQSNAPVIIDFGLARYRAPSLPPPFSASQGLFLGTVAYTAPEVLFGGCDSDASADVYSLGAIMYELLVGAPLHASKPSLVASIIERARRRPVFFPRRGDAEYPPRLAGGLEEIVLRALNEERESRFRDAGELADALDRWSAVRSTGRTLRIDWGDRRVSTRADSQRAVAMLVVMLVLATFGGLFANTRSQAASRGEPGRLEERLLDLREMGLEQFRQGNYDEAGRLFRAGLNLVDSNPSLPPLLVYNTMAACAATSRYPYEFRALADATGRLYQRVSAHAPRENGLVESIRALRGRLLLQIGESTEALTLVSQNTKAPDNPLCGMPADAWLDSRILESDILFEEGEYRLASAKLELALDTCMRKGRSSHVSAAYISSRLGLALVRSGESDRGVSLLRWACNLHHSLAPSGTPDLAVTEAGLGIGLFDAGMIAEAIEHLRIVYELSRQRLGFDHPQTLRVGAHLAIAELSNADRAQTPTQAADPAPQENADHSKPIQLARDIERLWILTDNIADRSLNSRLQAAISGTSLSHADFVPP